MNLSHIFKIKAVAPISHGAYAEGKDAGNLMPFRTLPMIGPDGEICDIPVLSGNSFRGLMRRLLTREYMEKMGFFNDTLYFLMANGGALSKSLDGYIRPEKIAQTRKLFPILSAFGSAMLSYMMPGQLNMGFAVVECEEMGTGKQPSMDLLTEVGMARHLDRDVCSYPDEAKPMPYVVEAVMPGASFDCRFSFLPSASELDKSTVYHGLNLIKFVGGKAAEGFGEVELSEKFDDSEYLAWLDSIDDAYREAVNDWLKEMKCSLK